jgi:hypothetical protein
MNDEQLNERLERLHAELEHVDVADPAEREHVERLRADIRRLLDTPAGDRSPEYTALGDRLRAGVTRLETSYPNAALAMGQLIDALANLGL